MSKNRIVISKASDCYMAEYQGPHSNEVFELFKTRTIPMGFTAQANAGEVIEYVKNRHPNTEVVYRLAA